VFSVPESQRKQRHALRSRLTWLGFGTVSAGVWIAPGHLAGETAEVLEHSGLSGYVSLFLADYLAFGDVARQVGQWWDRDRLQGMYQEFRDAYIPLTGARTQNDAAAFAGYVKMLTDWRRLPFLDPGLPAELLPAHWQGSAAADLFAQLRTLLDAPARRHVRAVVAESRS
jgi:phenylacetic acid degradation operon negative regulatory protein